MLRAHIHKWIGLWGLALLATGCNNPLSPAPFTPSGPHLQVSPQSLNLRYGDPGTVFSAQLSGASGPVSWQLSPDLGSLSAPAGTSVVYTPPVLVQAPTEVTLTARVEGSDLEATRTIHLQPPPAQTLECTLIQPSDTQGIVGYLEQNSFFPGDIAAFKVSLPQAGRFHLAVFRQATQAQLLYFQSNLAAKPQPLPQRPYQQALGWPTAVQVEIPSHWKSGLYLAKLISAESQTCFAVGFGVKSPPTARAPIALLANTFTWEAYNNWGGASFYNCYAANCSGRSTASLLSLARPNRAVLNANLATGVQQIAQWLEQQGYAYDLLTDNDLHQDPTALGGYRVLVLPRHSEYWSGPMRDHLDAFLVGGGHLLSLGGNQIYWKVAAQGQQLEVKKYKDDPQHTLVNEPGGLWRSLGRPEATVLGNRFDAVGMNAPAGPYRVLNPQHWALAGTGLEAHQSFGAGCSGWETDKLDPLHSPSQTELIAQGTNTDPARAGQAGADMVYYRHPGGGGVFAAGSLAFFSDECRADPTITRIVRNVLQRFLNP